jgi:MbtH protein
MLMDQSAFVVVRNREGQHSIWAADLPIPAGWVSGGKSGTREECLDYIREVWTDMAPASLRTPG